MRPTQFFARLQEGPLLPLYYFYGEEGYLQDKAVHLLLKREGKEQNRSLAVEVCSGASTSLSTIIDNARTLPLLGGKKFFLIREAEKLSTVGANFLLSYLKRPSQKTVLIFTGKKINFSGEIRNALSENGVIQELKHPSAYEVPDWIQYLAKERGKSIEPQAIHALVALMGNQLHGISNEMEKLCLFTGERKKITREDVEKSTSPLKVESIFELTDSIGDRKLLEALSALSQLMESGEAPLKILGMIVRHFRMMMKTRSLLDQKMQPENIRDYLHIRDFIWKKLFPQTKRFSREKLEIGFRRLWEADLSLKTQTQYIPAKIVLEQLVTDLCQ